MKSFFSSLVLAAFCCCLALPAEAAFVIEPDIDTLDDGAFTPSPNFSFGNDTVNASTSIYVQDGPYPLVVDSGNPLIGTTGGDSIFRGIDAAGGNPLQPHTYLYSYAPGVDGDNTAIPAGAALNDDGDAGYGLRAGPSGVYRVYATWPQSQNNSGGPVRYTLNDGGSDIATTDVVQNEDVDLMFWPGPNNAGVPDGSTGVDGNLKGNEWEFLFEVTLDASTSYVLTQQPTLANSFVSMRSGGVLFELVPEPTTALLAMAGLVGFMSVRRR